jgi:hypothetical protein
VRIPVVLGATVAIAAACNPYVQRGEALYHEGRYIEAAEIFELTEARLVQAPKLEQAEYGLYRGLTFLRLSDLTSARQWLGYANGVEHRSPGTLSTPEHVLLDRGWSELEQRARAEPVVAPDAARVAAGDAALSRDATSSSNGRRSVAP